MFYSHDILNNSQHGVATIWLVATLGSKSTLKKVTRKAILGVNVSKACDTITDPSAPMALRLQGSLLYGVSRVFAQQCGYVLTDMQSLQDKMRIITVNLREVGTDPNVVVQNDQLNIPDDPAFSIDLDMGLDLAIFDAGTNSEQSSLLSPRTIASGQTSIDAIFVDEEQLDLPGFDNDDYMDIGFGDNRGVATSSAIRSASYVAPGSVRIASAVVENPDFEIAEDGSIVMFPSIEAHSSPNKAAAFNLGEAVEQILSPDIGDNQPVFQTHPGDDDGMVILGDDGELPQMDHTMPSLSPAVAVQPATDQNPSSAHVEVQSESTAEAPQHPVRQRNIIRRDSPAELANRQLGNWHDNYLVHMEKADEEKMNKQSLAQAKRNAAFWVLDQGIGGVEMNFGADRTIHPLSIFSGQMLLNSLTGMVTNPAGKKRLHSASTAESDEDSARRVRLRSGEPELGRGDDDQLMLGGDEGVLDQGDEFLVESEVGREAPASLRERSSEMPWNFSSRHGSLKTYRSGLAGISSSAGGLGMELGPPSVLARRGSQLTSASPLMGKGRRSFRLDSMGPRDISGQESGEEYDFENLDNELAGNLDDDFELYGPSAVVSTQQAAQSQWVAAALEQEAQNFLLFLETAARTRIEEAGEDLASNEKVEVDFSTLLPAASNSKVVGAQAMLHVLALATKGLLEVQQDMAFGEIVLRVTMKGVVVQSAEEHNAE